MSIKENIERIRKITDEKNALLLVVSKYHTEEEIMECYNAGIRDFGENKVQDMVVKMENLPKDINWHLIGHLQKNKVKYIIGKTKLIHSVDSVELAQEISKRSEKENVVTDCLIQVNSTGIDERFGVPYENLGEFLESISKIPNINVKGLMGMAPITDNPAPFFEELKKAFDTYNGKYYTDGILSMGMSGDFVDALNCGSTLVRVGSKIFE
ncbi:MAG: YggS family pyridoxal phosphate-dependent enzyme [Clostridia bacterium]|nr:YggS family pyridoxal phosphate-dependent enzyme [Clostridia bacterium]